MFIMSSWFYSPTTCLPGVINTFWRDIWVWNKLAWAAQPPCYHGGRVDWIDTLWVGWSFVFVLPFPTRRVHFKKSHFTAKLKYFQGKKEQNFESYSTRTAQFDSFVFFRVFTSSLEIAVSRCYSFHWLTDGLIDWKSFRPQVCKMDERDFKAESQQSNSCARFVKTMNHNGTITLLLLHSSWVSDHSVMAKNWKKKLLFSVYMYCILQNNHHSQAWEDAERHC